MKFIGKFLLFLLVAVLVLMLVGAIIVLPLGLMGYGAYSAWDQDRAIGDAKTVPAQIVSSNVETVTSYSGKSRTTKHIPRIVFTYDLEGSKYRSNRVSPRGEITNFFDADAIVKDNPPGKKTQAWYRPGEPDHAFLLRRYDAEAYLLFFLGLALSIMPAFLLVHVIFYRKGKKVEEKNGKVLLPVQKPLRARVRANVARGIWFISLTALAGWHWVTRIHPPLAVSISVIGAGIALGILFLNVARRQQKVSGLVGDARVRIEAAKFSPGASPKVWVDQDLRSDIMVAEMKVGILCHKTVGSGDSSKTTKEYEHWESKMPQRKSDNSLASRVEALSNTGARSLATLSAEFEIQIPADKPPTNSQSPTIQWKLAIVTELPGPDYREEFEIEVKA